MALRYIDERVVSLEDYESLGSERTLYVCKIFTLAERQVIVASVPTAHWYYLICQCA